MIYLYTGSRRLEDTSEFYLEVTSGRAFRRIPAVRGMKPPGGGDLSRRVVSKLDHA